MVTIEFLNSFHGEAPMYIEDGDLESRKKIAPKLMELLKEGQIIFLMQGEDTRRIQGYDEASNQWQVLSDPQPRPKQAHEPGSRRRGRPPKYDYVPAGGTRVTAIGRSAGG